MNTHAIQGDKQQIIVTCVTAVPLKSFLSFYEATKKLGKTENGANLWGLR